MAYQGDVGIIDNWREEHAIEDLQRLVAQARASAISRGVLHHAARKVPAAHRRWRCEWSPG